MTLKTILLSVACLTLAVPVFAQPAPPAAPTAPTMSGQGPRGGLEAADANNDGIVTRDEVRAMRTATFTRLDANRDGFLVAAELEANRPQGMMGRRNRGGPGQGKGMGGGGNGEMLARADTNQDGNVSRAEFDAMLDMAPRDIPAAQRQAMFDGMDADRNGSVTRAEADAFRAAMTQRRGGGPDAKGPAAGGAQNPDTDGDGKVSLAEWLARPDAMFDRADTNNDGRVTREEMAAAPRMGRGEGRRPTRPW